MDGKLKTFFNSTDRKLLGAALVLILVCGYYLLVDETLFGLLRSNEDDSGRPVVGQISSMENDTRHKSVKSFSWSKARKAQQVRVGDSVFTGAQSSSRVDLTDGGHVDMSENTLIQFDDVKGLKVPNLKMGHFKLSVNGTMRVKINDEVTEIQGNGSEIQVEVTENKKPQIRVTKGKPVVQGSTAVIATAPPVEVPAPIIPPQRDLIPPPPVAPPPVATQLEIKPVAQQTPYIYVDKLYDFYERLPQSLRKRAERRREVDFPVRLQWESNLPLAKTYGQISETPGFERSVQFFETGERGGYAHKPVYLGTNYWRVSEDRTHWSPVEWFQVESKPLGFAPPEVILSQESLLLLGNQVQVKAKIEAASELKAFVVEISSDSNFSANQVRVQWTSAREITWTFKTAGEVYFRVRGVNQETEITAGGPVAKLTVVRPKRAEPPRLAKDQIQVYENDSVNVAWEKSPDAKSYQVELINPKGQVIQRQKVIGSEWNWKAGPKGAYQARISSYDKFGRQSDKVSETQVLVSSKPVAKVAPPVEKRKPAAVDSTTSMTTDEAGPQTFLNRNYPSSKIELVGAGFTMYSSEQISQNTEQPVAFLMGLHVQHWFGDHGAEGFLKSKVMGVNKASDGAAPLQAELRYNYRWKLNWNLFSKLRESQLSAIVGYEMYRNSSAGSVFASKYDLGKAGFGLAFPLFQRWDTGGEVLYGLGADASTKFEISGFVNYYLRQDWSAGMGYRLHLFQAGSTDSAPAAGLPYREGFGEAYSVLRWHY